MRRDYCDALVIKDKVFANLTEATKVGFVFGTIVMPVPETALEEIWVGASNSEISYGFYTNVWNTIVATHSCCNAVMKTKFAGSPESVR